MAEHISAEAGALAKGQQAVAEARQGIQQEIPGFVARSSRWDRTGPVTRRPLSPAW